MILYLSEARHNRKHLRYKQMQAASSSTAGPAGNQKQPNEDFVVWIVLDLEPFSIVINRGFRYFLRKNSPNLTIPDESTLRKSYAIQVYDRPTLAEKVKSEHGFGEIS